jgi:hypothetical protein
VLWREMQVYGPAMPSRARIVLVLDEYRGNIARAAIFKQDI